MWFTNRHGVDEALKSSTHEATQILFRTSFGDNSAYNGSFFVDTVRLGGAIMEKVRFGVSEKTSHLTLGSMGADAVSLIGVGFEANEGGVNNLDQAPYPNIVSSLRASGAIGARAFSLYINGQGPYIQVSLESTAGDLADNSLDAATGSILFGGVDSSLYTGRLVALPMIKKPEQTVQKEFAVAWTSFTSSSSTGDSKNNFNDLSNNTLPAYVLLDSGAEASTFPAGMLSSLLHFLGAEAAPDGHSYVPCDRANASARFEFGFGGPNGAKIVTPAGAFVKPYDPTNPDVCGTPQCCASSVDSAPDGSGDFVLGDNFLHSAYLVFDIDNEVIALAQSNLSPSSERNVREIRPGLNGIPGAVYGGAGNSSDISTAVGTAVGTASGAVASATGGFGGNITATGIQPPIVGFTGSADRTRRFGIETLMLGVAVGLCALMW